MRRGKPSPRLIHYRVADFTNPECYAALARHLSDLNREWNAEAIRIYYLATPPQMIEVIPRQLGMAGLARDYRDARIVVEKPFGRDLASARILNKVLTAVV